MDDSGRGVEEPVEHAELEVGELLADRAGGLERRVQLVLGRLGLHPLDAAVAEQTHRHAIVVRPHARVEADERLEQERRGELADEQVADEVEDQAEREVGACRPRLDERHDQLETERRPLRPRRRGVGRWDLAFDPLEGGIVLVEVGDRALHQREVDPEGHPHIAEVHHRSNHGPRPSNVRRSRRPRLLRLGSTEPRMGRVGKGSVGDGLVTAARLRECGST